MGEKRRDEGWHHRVEVGGTAHDAKKTGAFLVPGFAKFVVIKKPATKERKGINPFTKEPTVFKARPARKIIRARPVKAAKDAGCRRKPPFDFVEIRL